MKVSIVTPAYNSAATIVDTIRSVNAQDYEHIEHIIVDGASKDNTLELIRQFAAEAIVISEPDRGLYDAINKGISKASGDIVGILNSDDFFPNTNRITKIVRAFQQTAADSVFGDVVFVLPQDTQKAVRYYSSARFTPKKFAWGYMPAHPSFYLKREFYETYGTYKIDYKIAADYELLIRMLYTQQLSHSYIPEPIVYMRAGGVSNASIKSRYVLNKEIARACSENGISTNMLKLSLKYFNKVFEFLQPQKKYA